MRINDPLPPHPEQDSKRRLSDTIKCLNRKQKHPLIHFRGDGTGEGVIWEFVEPNGYLTTFKHYKTSVCAVKKFQSVENGLDFGVAQIVLLPGEAYVGYQLMAQDIRPDSFVMAIGYGECWPGYIPTKKSFDEHFGHGWRWVASGAEVKIRAALERVVLDKN